MPPAEGGRGSSARITLLTVAPSSILRAGLRPLRLPSMTLAVLIRVPPEKYIRDRGGVYEGMRVKGGRKVPFKYCKYFVIATITYLRFW